MMQVMAFLQEDPSRAALAFQREAAHRLPDLLADLLEGSGKSFEVTSAASRSRIDLLVEERNGRRWAVEVKSSSRPGVVSQVVAQLQAATEEGAIPLLVVPYMTKAGAAVAATTGVNWLDLSGNARIRAHDLYVRVEGRPNAFPVQGRPASAFTPRGGRIARALLADPGRWWRQRDLVGATGLDDGTVSRLVRKLDADGLLRHRDRELRPRDPDLLLDAWAADYRFDHHDIVVGHLTGTGMGLARDVARRLGDARVHHAFTGLPAAWAIDRFAQFRLTTVYVDEEPRRVADALGLRRGVRGANVQLVGPDDPGVFANEQVHDGLNCVVPVQVYLDLGHLPERADEAAAHLRSHALRWNAGA
jgi:hypothetical protein